ncbi:MAG: hypothetical protein GF383_09850 [Candidatus Lokiarchaeota archaeon]|nr:hypothetical protein [Candidatus Lokiarchaeota archaeon]MBD3340827.1 hypothetical protein [Candidatus Lokiarchaeota archaeon]
MSINLFGLPWDDFVNWYLNLPLFGQILVAVGILAISVLVITLIYYIIKGICYLIYYLFKGLYYLAKGIVVGIYSFFRWLYFAIFGKQEKQFGDETSSESQEEEDWERTIPETSELVVSPPRSLLYCPECGSKFTDSMSERLKSDNRVYCVFCGSKFDANYLIEA